MNAARFSLVAAPALAAVPLAVAGGVAALPLKVPAKADLFAAGLTATPALPGGGGVLPPASTFVARPGQVLTFQKISGHVKWGAGSPAFGPAGDPAQSTNIASRGGISGLVAPGGLFLAGVFLGKAAPKGAAPHRLRETSPGTLATIAPKLRQVFYIGSGMTSSGTPQNFAVPATATRLYLGFVDGFSFHGPPGYYDDNSGSFRVTSRIAKT